MLPNSASLYKELLIYVKTKTRKSEEMASFEQCQSCGTFLLSVDAVTLTNHFKHCSVNFPIKCFTEDITAYTETWERSGFRSVAFPELKIHLTRSISPPVSCSKVMSSDKGTGHRPRQRKRFPISETEDGDNNTSSVPHISSYRFDCSQCTGKFYSMVEYDRHMNVHNGSRKLMKCIVCFRMFNKRDSLNQHYAAHENAEEREEKLNLMHSWPKKTSDNPYVRTRQVCKYCLLVHTNKESFVKHMNSEHDYIHNSVSTFPCCLDKCSETFTTIKDLMQHAKDCHPLSFFGKFTLNKRIGPNVVEKKDKSLNIANANGRTGKIDKKKRSKPRKKKALLDISSSDEWGSEDEIITSSKRTKMKICSNEEMERKVELERVHIMDKVEENSSESVYVKKENTNFYSSCYYQQETDPFLMDGLTNQKHENTLSLNAPPESYEDSVPIVLAIKSETYY